MDLQEKENLAKNLVFFRKKNNLTQMELANKLGYSNKNISKWENSEIVPDIFMLNQLANIYNVTIDELFNGEVTSDKPEQEPNNEMFKKMRQKIIFLSFVIACLFIGIICVLITTILFSQEDKSEYKWLVYLYGGSADSCLLYVYFRIFKKDKLVSFILLGVFLGALSTSIYFSIHCSPWIFLIDVPLYFFIYNLVDLYHLAQRYSKEKKKKNS